MALPLKDELHRLIDDMADNRPDLVPVLHVLAHTLIHDLGKSSLLLQRFLRDVMAAQEYPEQSDELRSGLEALRLRWMAGERDAERSLPRSLAEAPEDDEPLTAEEIAILDERLAAAGIKPKVSPDEIGRMLRA